MLHRASGFDTSFGTNVSNKEHKVRVLQTRVLKEIFGSNRQ
jgi:hypothetical protein